MRTPSPPLRTQGLVRAELTGEAEPGTPGCGGGRGEPSPAPRIPASQQPRYFTWHPSPPRDARSLRSRQRRTSTARLRGARRRLSPAPGAAPLRAPAALRGLRAPPHRVRAGGSPRQPRTPPRRRRGGLCPESRGGWERGRAFVRGGGAGATLSPLPLLLSAGAGRQRRGCGGIATAVRGCPRPAGR